jgi:hypothetical protein
VAPASLGLVALVGLAELAVADTPPTSPFDRGKPKAATSPFDRGKPKAATSPFDRGKPKAGPPSCATAAALPCPRRDLDAPAMVVHTSTRGHLERLPHADADLAAVAGAAAGLGRDDGGLTGAGATGLDTTWSVEGAPIDDPRTGGLGLTVPVGFLEQVAITTAGAGAARDLGVGPAVDATLRTGGARHAARARLWLGAGLDPTVRARAPGEYTLARGRYASYRAAVLEVTADGPVATVAGGALWYAVGLAPRLADQALVRDVFRLVDRDGDAAYDRDLRGHLTHERIVGHRRDAVGYAVPLLARLGWRRGPHQVTANLLGEADRTALWLVGAEADAAGTWRERYRGTGFATWRGRWDATAVTATASWYRSREVIAAQTAAGAGPAIGRDAVPPLGLSPTGDAADDQVRAGCTDGGAADPAPLVTNCPQAGFYWTGGVGAIGEVTVDRPRLAVDLVHTAGEHRLAMGAVGDDVRAVLVRGWSGGYRRRWLGMVAVDERLVELGDGPETCDGVPCRFIDEASRTLRTRGLAAYLADTWRPAAEVAVEYGVRWQSSQLGSALTTRDWLPRVSAAWDPVGGGRSRVFVGWGRYAAALPVGLGERVFAGPASLTRFDATGVPADRVVEGTGIPVADDARGTRVDEVLAGAEVGLADVVRLGVLARSRHLGRALEDDRGYLGAAGRTGPVAARREFTEVAAWLDGAPTSKLGLRLGYAWSRLRGNWPGPIDPVEGTTLGLSTLFDYGADPAMTNALGALPNDEPHRFFAEVAVRGRWRGLALDGGVRATASSGRPRSARVGGDQAFLIPRGAMGRLPSQTRASLHLGARRGRLTVGLDVYNLFDRRGALAIDERYSDDGEAIAGGAAGDLVWLKTATGLAASRNRGYGAPIRFQAPLTALVGVAVEL